jgi:hypothetical protein
MVAVFKAGRPPSKPKRDPHAAIRQRLGLAKNRRQPVTLSGSVQDSLPDDGPHRTRALWATRRQQD